MILLFDLSSIMINSYTIWTQLLSRDEAKALICLGPEEAVFNIIEYMVIF